MVFRGMHSARRLVPSRRRRLLTAIAVPVSLALAACGGAAGTPSSTTSTTAAAAVDFARMVPIGDGRRVYLQCRGTGSPTVVLVSGTGGASDEWTDAVDPADPTAAPGPSAGAVLPTVASFTRVCAYDRPGTIRDNGERSPSTLVPQPTTAADGADDLRAVLAAADENGPYVLVGASWGAMITALLARTDSDRVSGLVTVDGASVFLKDTFTPVQWSNWMAVIDEMDAAQGLDIPDYEPSLEEIRAAPALPDDVPAAVLTSDQPWDLQVAKRSTFPGWLAAQKLLAADLEARHVTDTDSGHGIAVEQPQLVSGAIREVVDQARDAE